MGSHLRSTSSGVHPTGTSHLRGTSSHVRGSTTSGVHATGTSHLRRTCNVCISTSASAIRPSTILLRLHTQRAHRQFTSLHAEVPGVLSRLRLSAKVDNPPQPSRE